MGARLEGLVRFRVSGDHVDFDEHVLGEARNLNAGSGRRGVIKTGSINFVDGVKITEVFQKYGRPKDVIEGQSSGVEHSL